MGIALSFIITALVVLFLARFYIVHSEYLRFMSLGLDYGFNMSEIRTLWKLSRECDLDNPIALYLSVPALNNCISKIIMEARKTNSESNFQTQNFLTKLYKYRTKIALAAQEKRGLEDTRHLDEGQKLRLIYHGKGVFSSKILNNGRELVISLPRQIDKKTGTSITLPSEAWEGQKVSVYLWRKGDACYAFDTIVFTAAVFRGETALFLKHSDKLDRAQKRQSIRCNCEIYAQMYIIKSEVVNYSAVDVEPGYKCLLEDISEDGAMIRIGGKGKNNVQIKLQFEINETFVMMHGVIRAVEYNKQLDQSRLHFECVHIEPAMRNAILTYVYNVIPQEQKEINEAIKETEEEIADSEQQNIDLANELSQNSENTVNESEKIVTNSNQGDLQLQGSAKTEGGLQNVESLKTVF